MPAVELSDGKQVHRGYQQPHPTGKGRGVKKNVLARLQGTNDLMDYELEQQRFAQILADARGNRIYIGPGKPHHTKDDRGHEAGQGSGNADVEQGATVADVRRHADHRAHGAQRRQRHGDKIRVTGRDTVAPRLDEVARLVADQNRHQRRGIAPTGP